ncbi:XdhC family protein [Endozoicomonas sp. G2_1]|uniref:XdhC family protein n=1 Tax=Endozoicomonas sp. G2_1 TaxID=2821091 RepID=UPI001ADBDD54|nr:XdhC/CoxI family protein [Endozoicomonas sp. G2_1]MBO9491196.1 XdhC family protein [Endozoicomonas sp. G2_1]
MSNQLNDLLNAWSVDRDKTEWVLGTVYKTKGSSYRKAGAMMLFAGDGRQFGLLSGGCLESNIQRHARKVMQTGQSTILCYDGNDEDDISFQLGIGCGGVVDIVLQPITAENHYLELDLMLNALSAHQAGYYRTDLSLSDNPNNAFISAAQATSEQKKLTKSQLFQSSSELFLCTPVQAPPHFLICGGGIDARPLANIAKQLGWQVSVWDPRPANARVEFFANVDHLLRMPAEQLVAYITQRQVNAAMVMSHSVSLDVEVMSALSKSQHLAYVGLLGPMHRRVEVLTKANLAQSRLAKQLSGPVGLDLGGSLPESIALSILAECHACLHQVSGQPLTSSALAFSEQVSL